MAAAYLFHLSERQAFLDGNKRTAVLASLSFLWRNGVIVVGGGDELVALVLAIAERRADKGDCAAFFRRYTAARR